MQIKRQLETKTLDKFLLGIYGFMADYGESYLKLFISIIGLFAFFPLLLMLFTWQFKYSEAFTLLWQTVAPKALNSAMGAKATNAKIFIDYVDSAYLLGITWFWQGLFFILFYTLIALFIMTIRRRFRR
jgi:hypothetical protein